MPLSSFFVSADRARPWSVARAAAYGAGIGALAALIKTLGPLHGAGSPAARVLEIAEIGAVFALLCAGAALLRNFVARRLIWPELR
jgi:hypothetical protein